MKKNLLVTSIILLFIISVPAQSLTPFVVASSGSFYSNSTAQLSFTTGEMAMVETFHTANNFLTQGFQQPSDSDLITKVIFPEDGNTFITLYPNPVVNHLFVKINSENSSAYYFKI